MSPIGSCNDQKTACKYLNQSYCVKFGDEYQCRCENGYFGPDCQYCKRISFFLI
jgi:hypothetical protein